MLAFVMDEHGPRLQRDRPAPQPRDGFVRVRLIAAGICNTDLEIARGYMGFRGVLGHEFVGEALDGAMAGRRVVAGINFGCDACRWCDHGLSRHCPDRMVLGILGADGVLAEQFVVPERNLLEVPEGVSDEAAVFAEPVGAACEILEQLGHLERGPALVLGAGKLGSLVAQVLTVGGFEVDLVGRHLHSLQWMKERGVRLVGERPDRDGYAVVVEATGTTEGLKTAIACTRPRGHVVLKTTVAGVHEIDLSPVVINEISIVGSRCGQFDPALDLLADEAVTVQPLVEARYGLSEVEAAFAHAGRRGVRKVLVHRDV
ncbi:MAG TPA: alcohol dehydrogenase catalytic domain-containing protein [Candidatus Limnocylindrales bacterium]|nr:alcohol dehydrogenase catalytic domain-containing protein [Candidatus Limnocylindrales bacterium]